MFDWDLKDINKPNHSPSKYKSNLFLIFNWSVFEILRKKQNKSKSIFVRKRQEIGFLFDIFIAFLNNLIHLIFSYRGRAHDWSILVLLQHHLLSSWPPIDSVRPDIWRVGLPHPEGAEYI